MALRKIRLIPNQVVDNFNPDNDLLQVTFDNCETIYLEFDPKHRWMVARELVPQSLLEFQGDRPGAWMLSYHRSIGDQLELMYYDYQYAMPVGLFMSDGVIVDISRTERPAGPAGRFTAQRQT